MPVDKNIFSIEICRSLKYRFNFAEFFTKYFRLKTDVPQIDLFDLPNILAIVRY